MIWYHYFSLGTNIFKFYRRHKIYNFPHHSFENLVPISAIEMALDTGILFYHNCSVVEPTFLYQNWSGPSILILTQLHDDYIVKFCALLSYMRNSVIPQIFSIVYIFRFLMYCIIYRKYRIIGCVDEAKLIDRSDKGSSRKSFREERCHCQRVS